jgi:ferredoxin
LNNREIERNWQVVEIEYEACVGCGLCAEICPTGAISVILGKARVNPLACSGCGQCIEVCRTGATHWRYEETRPKVPTRPFFRRGGFGSYRFFSRQQASMERDVTPIDFDELKKRLGDMKKKADEIVNRIKRL